MAFFTPLLQIAGGGGSNIIRSTWFLVCVIRTCYGWIGLMSSVIREKWWKMKHPTVHQKCQICMEILKMRFSIHRTFHQISRIFYFWSDLDLAGDLDLWPWGTKFSQNILVMLAISVLDLNRIWAFFSWSKSLGNPKDHDLDLWPLKGKMTLFDWTLMYSLSKCQIWWI